MLESLNLILNPNFSKLEIDRILFDSKEKRNHFQARERKLLESVGTRKEGSKLIFSLNFYKGS